MAIIEDVRSIDLSEHGLAPSSHVHYSPTTALLYTHTLEQRDGVLAEGGPLVVDTGEHTGRSPNDKFIVREPVPKIGSGGARSTRRSTRTISKVCATRSSRISTARISTSSTPSPALIPRTGSRSG